MSYPATLRADNPVKMDYFQPRSQALSSLLHKKKEHGNEVGLLSNKDIVHFFIKCTND